MKGFAMTASLAIACAALSGCSAGEEPIAAEDDDGTGIDAARQAIDTEATAPSPTAPEAPAGVNVVGVNEVGMGCPAVEPGALTHQLSDDQRTLVLFFKNMSLEQPQGYSVDLCLRVADAIKSELKLAKLEGDAKAIIMEPKGREWMLSRLRSYEQASGDKLFRELPDEQLKNEDLVEAIGLGQRGRHLDGVGAGDRLVAGVAREGDAEAGEQADERAAVVELGGVVDADGGGVERRELLAGGGDDDDGVVAHAGDDVDDVRERSIAIEVVNAKGQSYPAAQIDGLIELLTRLQAHKRDRKPHRYVGHSDVSVVQRASGAWVITEWIPFSMPTEVS